MPPWMSVVVPVYNEEEAIVEVVSALRSWLDARAAPYEIVVVDNASEDRTVERLEPLLDGSRVRLLRNDANRGKGYSVRRGMLEASGRLRLLCDADCVASLGSLGDMVELIEHADVVLGSRNTPGAKVGRTQPVMRRIASWNFLALCRLALREPTRDIFCGFKLWRAEAATAVFPRQSLTGWAFDVEVLALARRLGFRIRELGIIWNDRKGSRLKMHRVLIPVVRELLQARRNVRRQVARGGVPAQPLADLLVPEPAESAQSPSGRGD
jgi:dolichyl-phosphate beta-glucosyltransferase